MPAEFVQRGRELVARAKHQEAVRVCRLGLLANPGEIEGRLVLGSALMALARYDEVLAEMRVAIDMDPDNSSAIAMKAEALLRKGDASKAREVLEYADQLAPHDPYVRELGAEIEEVLIEEARHPRTGTIDIDPEMDGVEVRSSRFDGQLPGESDRPDSVMEIDSSELEPISGVEILEESVEGFDRPGVSEDATGYYQSGRRGQVREPPMHLGAGGDEVGRHGTAPPFDSVDRLRDLPDDYGGPDHLSESGIIDSHGAMARRAQDGPRMESLFPEDESGVSKLELVDPVSGEPQSFLGPGGSETDDMRTIRAGLGMRLDGSMNDVPPGAEAVRAQTTAPVRKSEPRHTGRPPGVDKRRGKRKGPRLLVIYAALALLVVAGGLWVGLKVRDLRLSRDIDSALSEAEGLHQKGTYRAELAAVELYRRVHQARDSNRSKTRLARAEARLAALFGDGLETAEAAVVGLGDSGSVNALAARCFLALAKGDEKAEMLARAFADASPSAPDSILCLGGALAQAGKHNSAAQVFADGAKRFPEPMMLVGLARAEGERGQHAQAIAAIQQALTIDPSHAWAIVWRARILALAGQLPANTGDPDDQLKALVDAVDRGDDSVLSRAQGGWAALVLAQVKVARGEAKAAREAVRRAVELRPAHDWEFAQVLVDVMISLGDREAARAEVDMLSRRWPGRVGPIVLSARVSLSEGDAASAEDALLQLGASIAERPLALSLRGRARLELGRLDEAASDLDAAIAARGDLRAAVIARADVDRLRGDAKAAMERLAPYKDDLAGDAQLAVAYAGALRAAGELDKARDVLGPLIEAGRLSALLELSELERAAGNYKAATEVLDRALEINPKAIEARLGRAILDFESGEGATAAKAIRTLVDQAPNNARVLVEAARILTSTGDAEEADVLLTEAAKASSSLAWVVARERGRVMMRRMQPIEAISELERARSLQPADWETRILLMEAHFTARNKRGSARALQDITKSFQKGALRPLASGIHALASDRTKDSVEALLQAKKELEETKAAPREISRVAYWLGRAYEYEANFAAAAAAFEESVKLDPTQADAYYWLGQVDFNRQQFDSMIDHYRKSVEIDPGANPLAWSFLGHEYARRNMKKKTVESFEQFLKHWPEDSGDVVSEAKAMIKKFSK